mgnify:CR=1 FL=1
MNTSPVAFTVAVTVAVLSPSENWGVVLVQGSDPPPLLPPVNFISIEPVAPSSISNSDPSLTYASFSMSNVKFKVGSVGLVLLKFNCNTVEEVVIGLPSSLSTAKVA